MCRHRDPSLWLALIDAGRRGRIKRADLDRVVASVAGEEVVPLEDAA